MNPFDQAVFQLSLYRDMLLALPDTVKSSAGDIRFCAGQPLSIWCRDGAYYLRPDGSVTRRLVPGLITSTSAQLQELFLHLCGHSVFSHEQELREGYIQLQGGCRAGVCGRAVVEDGRVRSLRDITSIVLRIPRQVLGCADMLFSRLEPEDISRGLLIAGPPGSGKTTLLRDLIRIVSHIRRAAVLDTRGELSPGFELGPNADVLLSAPKAVGFQMALRSLSPELIACDELAPEDIDAVKACSFAGVSLIATVHSDAGSDPLCRSFVRQLTETGAFRTLISLRGRDSPFGISSLRRLEEAA